MHRFVTALAQAPDGTFWFWTGICAVFSLLCFGATFFWLRRARILEDTPTSLIRSAAQGYVELRGRAGLMPGPVILSPLSNTRCVWWRYTVEERQRSGNRDEWRVIDKNTSDDLFLLSDTTGDCIIDPDHASIRPSVTRRWRGPTPKPGRGPDGSWIDSLKDEEGIVYSDCDPDATVEGRMFHDIVGHYNRFDVLQLKVDRRPLGPVA